MNSFEKKPDSGASDDPSIPVLTDRLGFPPLEFDTTLPMIDSTLGKFEDASLDVPTVQPVESAAEIARSSVGSPAPENFPPLLSTPAAPATTRTYPPTPAMPGAVAPRSAQLPTNEAGVATTGVRTYGTGPLAAPGQLAEYPRTPPANPTATTSAPGAGATAPSATGMDSQYWSRMEGELRNAILRGLAERLPREVELVLRAQMSPAIDRLIDGLAADTRLAVAACVREIVEKAVRAELERLRPPH